jgi:hypothetical protein
MAVLPATEEPATKSGTADVRKCLIAPRSAGFRGEDRQRSFAPARYDGLRRLVCVRRGCDRGGKEPMRPLHREDRHVDVDVPEGIIHAVAIQFVVL